MIVIRNAPHNIHYLTKVEDIIESTALESGVHRTTTHPISFADLSAKIGENPAFLMLSMLKNPNCSKAGLETIIDVIQGIAGDESIYVSEIDLGQFVLRPLNFILGTRGFLQEDFATNKHMSCFFSIIPEANYKKSSMKDGEKGSYSLDLEINLNVVVSIPKTELQDRIFETVKIASVVVEFDGPAHLQDEAVRTDKVRDSMIQGLGKTVFRIQTPYKHKGENSQQLNKDNLSDLVEDHISDIKSHFRVLLQNHFATIDILRLAIEAEKNHQNVSTANKNENTF